MEIIKDIGIIGAGPAGMSAALYLSRSKYSFEIFEKEMSGGKLNIATSIENYPGIISTDGFSLGMSIKKQLDAKGIKIKKEEVNNIVFENNMFKITTIENIYYFKKVIVATGSSNKKLNIENEEKYVGKGISFCAVCDGFLFKKKDVAVFANSRNGYLEALYLANLVNKIYLISDKEQDDDENNLATLKSLNNVEFISPYKIISFNGDDTLKSIDTVSLKNKEVKRFDISACFPFVGEIPSSYFLKNLNLNMNKNGYIIVDKNMETSFRGVYACGDIIDKPLRQIVTACSDGAIAATSIIKELNSSK